jgi:4-amino-4-deoxy-L-arabinose transferase-like glycosyltransferase
MAQQPLATRAIRWPRNQPVITALLAIFLLKGILFAFVMPPYSGHDEVMHYAYLRSVAEDWHVPVVPDVEEWRENRGRTGTAEPSFDHAPPELGKYAFRKDSIDTNFTTSDWYGSFFGDGPAWMVTYEDRTYPSGWVYTANHPPLFYLLMSPVYWLVQHLDVDSQIYAFRLATILLGMATVLFAWLATRMLFPRDRFLAVTVPAFIAFQPQLSYEASMLNNDILAIALGSAIIYLLARGIRRGFSWNLCCVTGLTLGCAILAKNTSIAFIPAIAIAMVLGIGWRSMRVWIVRGAAVAGIAGVIAAPWFAYMWRTYGDLTALDRIRALQWWNLTSRNPRTVMDQLTDPDFAWLRWRETWGEFGWRLIPLDDRLNWILFWVCLTGLAGLLWWAVRQLLGSRDSAAISGVVTMIAICLVAYYAILQFGTTFALTQARYYFPALPAFAILVMLGYRAILPPAARPYAAAAFIVGWFALNVALFTVYVIPYWYLDAT